MRLKIKFTPLNNYAKEASENMHKLQKFREVLDTKTPSSGSMSKASIMTVTTPALRRRKGFSLTGMNFANLASARQF